MRDGRSYGGAADADELEREDRGRRRRGGRRGREDSAGGRGDDESREGGRSRRARRMPGEPLPDGGTEVAAKDACLRLLTDRARSRSELADRLATKGFSVEVANRALDRLTEVGLIDDAAFAQEWVYSRHTFSGKGKKALALELRRKGIDEEQAQEALSTISSDDETERAAELVRRKLRSLPASLDREKAIRRLVGMLARRGYNPGTAYTVVKAELEGFTFAAPGDDSEE
ncbi:recombination regulator RecX [Nocardia sp. NPDC057668]|uniref:recombination regulator RecX n=1 Tax=Nocardia sp. NPDC057668 TaxID=3346202 RepID=UPI0036703EEF